MGGLDLSDYNRGRRPQSGGASRFGPSQTHASARGQASPRGPVLPRATTSNRRPTATRRRVPQTRPTSVGSSGGDLLPKGFWPVAGVCALILLVGVFMQLWMPDGFVLIKNQDASPRKTQMISEIHSAGPVRINEIMSSNGGVITDRDGNSPDWVEIANVSNGPVNMKGYVLARNAKAGNVFIFPDMVLQPGECAIVFADSHLSEEAGGELHAPFRLSASGDVLMLFNQADVAVDTVNIPALKENAVYARVGKDQWQVSEAATPGALNTEENYRAMTSVSGDSPVQIVEVMSSSATYAPDENGVCHDYVILKNVSGSDQDLGGWYLSDTQQLPRMWRIPDGTGIPAGGTLLIHCSGLNRAEDVAHLHTNFKLSSEGEQVMLSDPAGKPMDLVTFDLLKTDTAIVRGADGSWSAGAPTAEKTTAQTPES